jgi:hypothetical protein
MTSKLTMALAATATIACVCSPAAPTLAQGYGYPGGEQQQPNYPQEQPPPGGGYGYPDQAPQPGYGQYPNQQPQPGYGGQDYSQAPPGYDGSAPPPPPPGYAGGYAPDQSADDHYAMAAQQWASQYCVPSQGNTAAGAVIGGTIGALIGAGVAGYGHEGYGALAGAAVGGVSGAAIAANAGGATSPGCPPGYVTTAGAPVFGYAVAAPYYYAAPAWYHPWVMTGGHWLYHPYPYHTYYYSHYGQAGYYGHPYYGHPSYSHPYYNGQGAPYGHHRHDGYNGDWDQH